jgi:sRNA-binding protein
LKYLNELHEQEKQVASQSDNIDSLDEKISNDIQSYVDEAKAKKDAEAENEAKAKKDAQAKKDAEEKVKKDAETQQTPPAPIEKKSSKGWLIFGALALVVTLGAVNVMNKD